MPNTEIDHLTFHYRLPDRAIPGHPQRTLILEIDVDKLVDGLAQRAFAQGRATIVHGAVTLKALPPDPEVTEPGP